MKKHAILLSGGVNSQANYRRYKNDLEFVYRVLIEDCGFQKVDVKIFYANGVSLDYNGEEILTKEASIDNILEILEDEKNDLNMEDELVLVVSNHGGSENGGCINLWGSETLSLDKLSQELQKINARKILLLGECFAGNILKNDINNACIMTANMSGMESYTNPYNNDYDEFLYHFFSYIHGCYPSGKSLKQQGENNVKEAFHYAVDMDVFAPNNLIGDKIRKITGKNLIEIPQMKCDIKEEIKL